MRPALLQRQMSTCAQQDVTSPCPIYPGDDGVGCPGLPSSPLKWAPSSVSMASAKVTSCPQPHDCPGWHFPLEESFPPFGIHVDNTFHHWENACTPICLLDHTGCHCAKDVCLNHLWMPWVQVPGSPTSTSMLSFSVSSFCPSNLMVYFPQCSVSVLYHLDNPIISVPH